MVGAVVVVVETVVDVVEVDAVVVVSIEVDEVDEVLDDDDGGRVELDDEAEVVVVVGATVVVEIGEVVGEVLLVARWVVWTALPTVWEVGTMYKGVEGSRGVRPPPSTVVSPPKGSTPPTEVLGCRTASALPASSSATPSGALLSTSEVVSNSVESAREASPAAATIAPVTPR